MEGISPLPWFRGADEDGDCIYAEEDGKAVLVAQTMREDGDAKKEVANARLILTACNSHADLLVACEKILAWFREPRGFFPVAYLNATIREMDAAIAEAEGGAK